MLSEFIHVLGPERVQVEFARDRKRHRRGVVGLLVFATFAAAQLRGAGGALLGTAIGYPALVGAPAGALVLWLGRGRAG